MTPTRMRLPTFAIIALSAAISLRAQGQPQTQGQAQKRSSAQQVYEGPLELPCSKILAMPSSDYIAQVVAIDDSNVDGQLRGIRRYGACYDERTDRLAASLGKQGKGPLMGARGNFRDFESALKDFTAKALEVAQQSSNGPLAPVKTEYAALYEKQFRYAFYEGYFQKLQKRPSSETTQNSGGSAKPSPTDAQSSAKPEADPMTLAKNRFGELLANLPGDKRHEMHAAFGQIFERSSIGEQWKLEIYRYAIFLLEPSADKPFSPPPF
ncbi:MAG: hypothetical protein WCD49_13145 [Candidatus Acidiferrales bacterium]